MLMPNRNYPHLSHQIINDVAQVIDNHLRGVWVIRVEYTGEIEYLNTSWQQWGKAFFKVKDSVEVVNNIYECHTNNQLCSIRLHAEKVNPVSGFYYSVCQACPDFKESKCAPLELVKNDVNLSS